MTPPKSADSTIIAALRILARDIPSDDGVTNACIAEAADRLEELTQGGVTIPQCIGIVAMAGDTASTYAPGIISIQEQSIRIFR